MSQVKYYHRFALACNALKDEIVNNSLPVHTEKWQGINVSSQPAAQMREILFPSFRTPIWTEDLTELAKDIQPNLPWADRHFEEERVSGQPINPGETWKIWPWGHSADKHRVEGEQFNHSYAERYWPKYANMTPGGILPQGEDFMEMGEPTAGIRYAYGDLGDVVNLLVREPLTRQAFLPVFFPEDTGAVHGGRIPCSIGYHFINRNGHLHVTYQLRSCDFYRHFRDDVYLTVRLLLWVLDNVRELAPTEWNHIKPGMLIMHISSLHVFINDWRALGGK